MRHRKSNRSAMIDFLLISSIITLTAIIIITISITGQFKFQKTTVAATANPNVEIPSLIDITDSSFPGIEIVTETSINSLVPYTLHYPKTPFDSVNEQIKTYINDSRYNYITALHNRNEKNKVKTIGNLNITSEIHEYNDQFYSIVLKNESSLNRLTYEESFNTIVFHKDTGNIVHPRELLNDDVGHLDVLAKAVRAELLRYYNSSLNEGNLANATSPRWEKFSRFAIIDNSIVFYFNQGEVAVKDVGSPTVTLPISYLNPILASVFQSEEKSEVTIVTPKENKKKVALTFDDGPHPKVTMQILNTLEKYDAKATFFMLGKQVEKHTDIAKEVVSRGHEIGNHTYNHPELTKQSTSQVQWQVDHTDQIIFDVIGEYPTVFRPPYGAKNQHVDSLIDVPVIMWTIDTYDWKHRDPNKLLPAVKANLHDGAIILMHDIHQSTADGLESVLIYLQQEGYEFVTVSELLAEQN